MSTVFFTQIDAIKNVKVLGFLFDQSMLLPYFLFCVRYNLGRDLLLQQVIKLNIHKEKCS